MPRYAVTIISPPGYIHAGAFQEIAESLHHGLLALGHDSVLTTDPSLPERQHIVLGANLLPHYPVALHPGTILYNLEQVTAEGGWFSPELLQLYQRFPVWDYSARNAAALATRGIQVQHVLPVGYVPELTRIQPAPVQDIDVLFIGSMAPRRQEILNRMEAKGLRVTAAFGLYGAERDALIARARVMLNVHYYEAHILEIVRISYLLANRCVVLSEPGSDPEENQQLSEGVAFAAYDDLANRAAQLIRSREERDQLSRRGFEIIRARSTAEYLRQALAQAH